MLSITALKKTVDPEIAPNINRAVSFLIFCAVFIFSLPSPVFSADAVVSLSLEGRHRFSGGDNPEWATPFNDDNWLTVRVPGDLVKQGMHVEDGMGWYRIRFTVPESFETEDPALALGNVGNADEVYLNGVKIGGQGRIGDGFVEAPWKERLYLIPKGLLHYRGENLLAIRFMNTYRMTGIFEGPVCIGDYGDLILRNRQLEFHRRGGEIALFTLSFIFLLGAAFLVVHGVRSNEYTSFILFLILYIALLSLESLYFYDAGLKGPVAQRSIFTLSTFLPASGLLFLVCLFEEPMGWWIRILMAASFLLGLFFLFSTSYEAYHYLMNAWFVLSGSIGITVLFLAVRAAIKRRHESGPVLVGIFGLLAVACLDFMPVGKSWHVWPLLPSDLGMVFLLLCVAYALMARYARTGKAVKQLSGRILEAQQDERKRFSRDIHDGPGQSLLALKLRLQMMNARSQRKENPPENDLPELIDEVDAAIKELKNMAMDLQPAFLHESSVVQLFTLYGKLFTERTGLFVEVAGSDTSQVPLKVKENLYRIYQEALGNIAKHAGAHRIRVRVEKRHGHLTVTIHDDGKGFDAAQEANAQKGVGLMSMKERTELVGGAFRIKSAPGEGCILKVEVPVK
jgi:signal transduction histidine kinase